MATVTRYVDTASSGGDGTTQGHSGSTAAYASMSAWESAEQTDLVTDGDSHVVNCAGSTNDTTAVTITGWTTGASNTLTIQADATAPDGDGLNTGDTFDTAFYVFENNGTGHGIQVKEEYTTIQTIQIENNPTSNFKYGVSITGIGASNKINILRNRFKAGSSNSGATPLFVNDADIVIDVLANTFESDGASNNGSPARFTDSTTVNFFNNTVSGYDRGVETAADFSGTLNEHNNAIFNTTNANEDFLDNSTSPTAINFTHNATDDYGTSDNNQDISPGGTESDGWNDAVTDYANGDFTIKDGDSVLVGNGTTGGPSTDINGVTYSANDIGAFAYVAAGGGGGIPAHWNHYNKMRRSA